LSKVAVVPTTSKTVIDDYSKLLNLIEYQNILKKDLKTILKINLSWTLFYPACSTPPWQLDGVLNKLVEDGYTKEVECVENQTVVTHPWKGAYLNKWLGVLNQHEVPFSPLTNENWVTYKPKGEIFGMYELFEKIIVPKKFMGSNMIHLPTIKTHGHTITTGAMKNAFGGLIPKYRHHSHRIIDEILVDLLTIQKEIHHGLLAVMDGSVSGNGAGPRTMVPYYSNTLLASEDQVAVDAVSAKLMGFDPLSIKYIKLAHDKGLGIGDIDQIEILGMDKESFDKTNFNFKTKKSIVIKWDQRIRKTTHRYRILRPFHWLFFYTPLFKINIFASYFFHDVLWYPTAGKKQIKKFNETEWGQLFNQYPFGEKMKKYPEIKNWNPY
jgi:hypothetical protein